jgi:hypothetical protein
VVAPTSGGSERRGLQCGELLAREVGNTDATARRKGMSMRSVVIRK